jgi:hypothetical protein
MLGVQRMVSMSEREARELWQQSQRRGWLLPEMLRVVRQDKTARRWLLATREGHPVCLAVERLLPRFVTHARSALRSAKPPPGGPPNDESAPAPLRPWVLHYLAKRSQVLIDKAREFLGYRPVLGLEDGMRLTEQWARWAGLLW